jgi:alanine racemase
MVRCFLIILKYITPVLYALDCARRLDSAARDAGRSIDYHLKVDTGMGGWGSGSTGSMRFCLF